ncbi:MULTISPECIES: histidinol dehydrogenase [Microbacterium]|uniref:Histidinol dehydrogenase n=1 Tax=Microbacterium hominis TaxID=162426 RepID=A0A134DK71_9MICO|nr:MULTISPECIES: histidinol dehydrogenase [Microbacterium]AUG30038.1 histidinol dehydrogenase [Microbacterium hominis]KXC06944.1 histidinol dehydrogenase [Microbacterium hominis]QOC25748.1 histidinol dehydrogenase [Microbacterium hominis]QOC29737.1 histidinol dehydrogenase [Microbacterium hominis]QYF97878.1 histidinol dehydrogenase [Microbacterium sp. PAMC21962]
MLRTIDLRGRDLTTAQLLSAVPRAQAARAEALQAASDIVADVRERGEASLRDQAARFDRVTDHDIRVPAAHLDEALEHLDPTVRRALEEAIRRVRIASAAQVPPPTTTDLGPGARVEQRWQPVRRAGVYVPGGKAVYPSSVVMNVVPAQVAGVGEVALASPPQAEFGGRVHPDILAAARLLGVTEVYAIGGAGAVGAYAYGVESIGLDPVDVVTGPGNNFVAAAKRAVGGLVGTDSEAGATEILIVADESADAALVAVDLISQAEHDEQASAVLVTWSPELAESVRAQVAERVERTRNGARARVALNGPQSAVVLVDDLAVATAFSNAYAPEHLELHLRAPRPEDFVNAGAVFVGENSPVSLGDYLAGSNHVLPTGGQARYAAGLSASTFLRPQQVIAYDREALRAVHDGIVALAVAEELPAHGEAVTARFADVRAGE